MHELIISPFLDTHVILRPGAPDAVTVSRARYEELCAVPAGEPGPDWFRDAAAGTWRLDTAGMALSDCAVIRPHSLLGYGRASYELNLGCNYACKHCYLGLKEFAGLGWEQRARVLEVMREAGVLWLQLTGGEPLIDPLFTQTYARAYELGMMLEILTNGSRLASPAVLGLLTSRPVQRVTVSVYGASAGTYDGLTRRRGSFRSFTRGLGAAREAGLPLDPSIVITRDNAHEVPAMRAMAEQAGMRWREYANISPTIYGGAESLDSQSMPHLSLAEPFTGCNAGHTSFRVDPHGRASICKVGRDPSIDLVGEGAEGLWRLGGIADQLLRRQGGCAGCALSSRCATCMPLAAKYREAKAPLDRYCQHGERR